MTPLQQPAQPYGVDSPPQEGCRRPPGCKGADGLLWKGGSTVPTSASRRHPRLRPAVYLPSSFESTAAKHENVRTALGDLIACATAGIVVDFEEPGDSVRSWRGWRSSKR
ncbi:hypothetical protein JCM8547_000347 [Rhodosporidiobolus lusitaniae]